LTSPAESPPPGRPVPWWVFAGIALLAFGRALFSEYTYDGAMLMTRWMPRGSSIPAGAIFSTAHYSGATGVMSWRPIPILFAVLLDIRVFAGHPAFSHAVNILIHATCGWVLYRVLAVFLAKGSDGGADGARALPFMAALLFLVHPLVSEAVLCAGFRFDLSALMFVLLALWAALAGWRVAWVCGLTMAGLLCKENAVVAVAVVPAAVWALAGDRRRAVILFAGLLLSFAVYLSIWMQFKYVGYTTQFAGGGGRLLGMANFLVIASEIYLNKLLLPWPLRVDYAFEPIVGFANPRLAIAAVVVGGAALVLAALSMRDRMVALGALWIAASFAPVSQIVPVPDPVAERFCYFPMVGVAIVAAALWRRLPLGRAAMPVAAGALLSLGVITHVRSWNWSDDVTLNIANWEQPGDTRPVARRALGALHTTQALERGRAGDNLGAEESFAAARANLEALVADQPNDAEGHRLLGVWFLIRGNKDDARIHARRALELAPADPAVQQLAAAVGEGT